MNGDGLWVLGVVVVESMDVVVIWGCVLEMFKKDL